MSWGGFVIVIIRKYVALIGHSISVCNYMKWRRGSSDLQKNNLLELAELTGQAGQGTNRLSSCADFIFLPEKNAEHEKA